MPIILYRLKIAVICLGLIFLGAPSVQAESKAQLLDLLMLIQEELPFEQFFSKYGLELFAIIFKVTYYSPNAEFTVNNWNAEGDHERPYIL